MPTTNQIPCHRCGKCCEEVGASFWRYGNLDEDKPFGDIEELNIRANNGIWDDEGKCAMLVKLGDFSLCQIEVKYGHGAKPTACKEYPQRANLCFCESVEHAKATAVAGSQP